MTPTVQIGNLRLRLTRDQVGAVTRTRLARSLARADLRPDDIPPSAVLVVRWLADPLPRRMLARSATAINPAWERAVRATLAAHYLHASRPAAGPVPAGAEAVAFSDEAEMLACLLHDAASKQAGACWWWKQYRRSASSWQPAALARAQAKWIPAALNLLTARGQIARVLNAISQDEVDGLLSAIADAYEVPARDAVPRAAAAANRTDSQAGGLLRPLPPVPLWIRDIFLAIATQRLAPERERLMATALILHRDRSALTLPAVVRALAAGPANYLDSVPSIGPDPAPREVRTGARIGSATGAELADRSALDESVSFTASVNLPCDSINDQTDPRLRRSEQNPQAITAKDSSAIPSGPLKNFASTIPDEGCITELSGVLHLVNVLRSLNLPECFAGTWHLPQQINTWELVESLARGLLANASDDFVGDPVWLALAELAGREPNQSLGANVTAAEAYDLPGTWLSQWSTAPTDRYAYSDLAGRLHVWSQAGFVLARRDSLFAGENLARDVLRQHIEDAERVSLLARPAAEIPLAFLNGPLCVNFGSGLRDWLSLAVPYIRRRLARALGIENDQVGEELLQRRGRLYVTRTHVDVRLPLVGASISIRRAGLDFDPGWVPELGRIVKFHYE